LPFIIDVVISIYPHFYISLTIPADKIICFTIDLIEFPLKYKYQFQQNPFIIITFIFLVSIRNFDIFLHYFILKPSVFISQADIAIASGDFNLFN